MMTVCQKCAPYLYNIISFSHTPVAVMLLLEKKCEWGTAGANGRQLDSLTAGQLTFIPLSSYSVYNSRHVTDQLQVVEWDMYL
jgi:hypothetical protein